MSSSGQPVTYPVREKQVLSHPNCLCVIQMSVAKTIWYLQFHLVCDKLFTSFILNDLPLLLCAVGRPHPYSSKGSFSLYILRHKPFLEPLAQRVVFFIYKNPLSRRRDSGQAFNLDVRSLHFFGAFTGRIDSGQPSSVWLRTGALLEKLNQIAVRIQAILLCGLNQAVVHSTELCPSWYLEMNQCFQPVTNCLQCIGRLIVWLKASFLARR